MSKLESQIAKIQLFSPRIANNYIYVLAEKAQGSDAEIYMVAELPLLNPAAKEACEQICLAVASAFRRVYKRSLTDTSFETAVAQINEELGKLAGGGQTYWINKFNCVLGVKNGSEFTISTCGKTAAFLLRGNEFTDINTSVSQSHPLKTFDSFATGKIKLNDVLILSNTQLLNFVSMDRLKEILHKENFLAAAQTVIELLKETAGPEIGFGTVLNMQVLEGQNTEESVDLENYSVDNFSSQAIWAKILAFAKSLLAIGGQKRQPKVSLPHTVSASQTAQLKQTGQKASVKERLSQMTTKTGHLLKSAKGSLNNFSGKMSNVKAALSVSQIKEFSPAKKILFFSIIILIFAAGLNIAVTYYNKNIKEKKQAVAGKLESATKLLGLAESSLLYKDENQAILFLKQAEAEIPPAEALYEEQKETHKNIILLVENLKKQIDRQIIVEAENLGSLAESGELISLANYLAVQSGQNIISYEKTSGKIEDGKLKSADPIKASYALKSGSVVIYTGEALKVWDYSAGTAGTPLVSSVPPLERFVGLSYYPTNNRIYLIDKEKNQIISFLVNNNKLQNPVVAINGSGLNEALDIAIDGNIYVLKPSEISKYSAGKLSSFPLPFTFEAFSGNGKIYTEVGFNYIYLMDVGKNRILIIDKKGALIKMLVSDKFTNLKDFAVDESQMTIYVLNGNSLLKVNY